MAFLIFLFVGRGMPPAVGFNASPMRPPMSDRRPRVRTYIRRIESASCSLPRARWRIGSAHRKRRVLRPSSSDSDAVCLVVTPLLFRKSSKFSTAHHAARLVDRSKSRGDGNCSHKG